MADQPEERWVTYREAGQLLGISANAVRVRAQRARWPRRLPNMPGAPTLVRVRPGAPSGSADAGAGARGGAGAPQCALSAPPERGTSGARADRT
jgi:hypothetical protein